MEENARRRCSTTIFCGRIGLLMLMAGYAFLGAFLFKTLEGGNDGNFQSRVQISREDCLRELWLITERLNVLYEKNWTRLVTEQLKNFEKTVVEAGKAGASPGVPQWTFGGALLYSLTLLTTVGYGRLSPKTSLGKVAAAIYALIGVPLMLILLSALGAMLACGARKIYSKLCRNRDANSKNSSVDYHKSSPSGRPFCKTHEESTLIQINNSNYAKTGYQNVEHGDVPKRAILATVKANQVRGRCRQTQIRQMLADASHCPTHSHNTSRISTGSSSSDVDDGDDPDENEHELCSHDTPTHIPLIRRPHSPYATQPPSPPVPVSLVLLVFCSYVCVGATMFATTSGWSFLDATYFCFIALSTIGIDDVLLQTSRVQAQLQLVACCLYLFVGLVVVAMCLSLVHEEILSKCRHVAKYVGLWRHQ